MEANLKQNTRNDQTSTIKHSIHSMDVDRVRYVLTSYVRNGYFCWYQLEGPSQKSLFAFHFMCLPLSPPRPLGQFT